MKNLTTLTAAGPLILAAMMTTVTAPGAMAQAGAQPLLVRDTDNPARHVFAYHAGSNWIGNASIVSFVPTIPPGKRLVIEQVSFLAVAKSSVTQRVSVAVQTTSKGATQPNIEPNFFYFMGANAGPSGLPSPARDAFIGGAQMRSYADLGVEVLVTRADTSGGAADAATVSISGYLVDLP